MASATTLFAVQRESLGRYIRERKLRLAARDLRDTDQRVYDICLKYGFDSQQTFTRILPAPFISRRAPTVKRTTIALTEAHPPGKPADALSMVYSPGRRGRCAPVERSSSWLSMANSSVCRSSC
jgi:hypothetical protein